MRLVLATTVLLAALAAFVAPAHADPPEPPLKVAPDVINAMAAGDAVLWRATELYHATIRWQRAEWSNAHPRHRTSSTAAATGTGACGDALPPCSVMLCENGGKLTGRNPRNHRVSGKWQIDDGTWARYGGYASAEDAPESVQDERAAQIYNGGRGRRQWAC